MKYRLSIMLLALLASSGSALADLHLTPQQCNEYPFKKTTQVTQRGLQRELRELEAVGYHPAWTDVYYPDDIQGAEQKLQAVYQRDCGSATVSQNTTQ